MRPSPEQTVMVIMVHRKVVGQRFAVEPIDRMNVAGANARFANAGKGHIAKVVYQHRSLTFPKSERCFVDLLEMESGVIAIGLRKHWALERRQPSGKPRREHDCRR